MIASTTATKPPDGAVADTLFVGQLDSAFQLQEHLAALHYYHTNSATQAITRTTAVQLATPPQGIDRTLWLYELCRFLISQCNTLIIGFLFDAPPCSATTCPEMRASEWQFLCAVHEQPKSCCAIDYCCHTLDWAANVVTDPKIFPSRFVVSADVHIKGVAVKNLVNVFRRLHRIFAHAWFQHRAVFWNIEGQTGLYVFFKTVCDMYELLPAENYKLPPEAEGLETPSPAAPAAAEETPREEGGKKSGPAPGVTIAKPPAKQQEEQPPQQPLPGSALDENYQSAGRTNTRRHIRASPSTGSAVTTVMETDEEDHDVANKLKELTISAPETVEEESEMTEVPVIVEQEIMTDASPTEEKNKEDATTTAPDGEQDVAPEVPAPDVEETPEKQPEQESAPEEPAPTLPEAPEPPTEETAPEAVEPEQTEVKSEPEEAPKTEDALAEETAKETKTEEAPEAKESAPTDEKAADAPAEADAEDTQTKAEEKKPEDETPAVKDA